MGSTADNSNSMKFAVAPAMGATTETSNSMKFAPLRLADLMPNLMALKELAPADSPDASDSSGEDSDRENRCAQQPPPRRAVEPSRQDSWSRSQAGTGCSSETCPSAAKRRDEPVPKIKRRTALAAQDTNARGPESFCKRTPEMSSLKRPKSSTPVIKPGIKKFTPGSARSVLRSQRKTPVKTTASPSKESVRCLFPDPQRHPPETTPQQPLAPETPLTNRAVPKSVAATPSYPHTGQHSKILLKSVVIQGKSYMFIKKLGAGGSSEVFKVLEVSGDRGEYAVKSVNLAVERGLAQSYINEIRLLRELKSSDRVIHLHAYEYDKVNQSLKMVLEVGETDLSSFLRARAAAGLPPALVLYYWEEMLHAVHHIHQHGVVHADLKPANFLLVCGRLKLIDFGIASAISGDATSVVRTCAAGTFSYISPEALMGGAGGYGALGQKDHAAPIKISFRSDVWSLGCILYSMVYGCTPFGHITHVYGKISAIVDPNHVINFPAAENMPPNLMMAMKWCLTYNAKSRPSVRQLLDIEYLSPRRQGIPSELLNKVEPHVTREEFDILKKATV